jgi:hypothetical protein
MATKYRPVLTMLEIESLLALADFTLQHMREEKLLTLQTALDEIPYPELYKAAQKLYAYKYKVQVGINMPAYTATRTKPGRKSNTEIEQESLGVRNSETNDAGSDTLSPAAILYTKYMQGEELDTKDKIAAIDYKMQNDKDSVTTEEREFYTNNFHLTL